MISANTTEMFEELEAIEANARKMDVELKGILEKVGV